LGKEELVNDTVDARLAGKTAFVTGGGNGIGREIALTFSRHGARAVTMDINAAANHETARIIQENGGKCECVEGDISVAAEVERAFGVVGEVDILIIMRPHGLVTDGSTRWQRQTGTGLSTSA
jgi:NAD(P)-dependent dehydrogenase (short-subunit alcohol dehydrogenase family)